MIIEDVANATEIQINTLSHAEAVLSKSKQNGDDERCICITGAREYVPAVQSEIDGVIGVAIPAPVGAEPSGEAFNVRVKSTRCSGECSSLEPAGRVRRRNEKKKGFEAVQRRKRPCEWCDTSWSNGEIRNYDSGRICGKL